MSYLDSGYNQFFTRELSQTEESEREISEIEFDTKYAGIPADKLVGGSFKSEDGSLEFNLQEGYFVVNSKQIERIRIGNLGDEGSGMIIKDVNGNVIFKISNIENYISSPDGQTKFNFDKNRIEVFDFGFLQTIIGKIK